MHVRNIGMFFLQNERFLIKSCCRGTYPNKIFRRFSGLFWPIFDLFLEVNILLSILTSKNKSKSGSKEPKNRLKLFIRIGSGKNPELYLTPT